LHKAIFHRLFVKFLGLPVNHLQGTLWTVTETGSESVTVDIADQAGLAIDDCDRTLGTCCDTIPASITELFVDFDDFTYGHESLDVPQHRENHPARLGGMESVRNIGRHADNLAAADAHLGIADGQLQAPVDHLDQRIEWCGVFRQALPLIKCKQSHVATTGFR